MRKILILGCLALVFNAQANAILKYNPPLFMYKKSLNKNNAEDVEAVLLGENSKIEYYHDKTYFIIDAQELHDTKMRISQYPNLTSIYIASASLSTNLIGEIGLIAPQLENLSLCNVTIANEKDTRALQRHLSSMQNIKTLTIVHVTEANGSTARILDSANITQLTELNLDNRSISQDELNTIAKSIAQSNNLRKLRLDIRSNVDLSAIIQALSSNTCLDKLEIGVHNASTNKTTKDKAKSNPTADTNISQMKQLLQAISLHTNLHNLALRYSGLEANTFIAAFEDICKNCPLIDLDLSGFNIDAISTIAVLRAIKNASQIRVLNLSGMKFDSDTNLEFRRLMQDNKTLERLLLNTCFPKTNNGENNECNTIFEALPWQTLKQLSICNNDLRNMNIDFAQYIGSQTMIIDACNCWFTTESLQTSLYHLCETNKSVVVELRDAQLYNSTSSNTTSWSLTERIDFRDKITIKARGKNTVILGL